MQILDTKKQWAQYVLDTKKQWAQHVFEKQCLDETLKIFININYIINEHYSQLTNKFLNKQFNILMDYFLNDENYIDHVIKKYLT